MQVRGKNKRQRPSKRKRSIDAFEADVPSDHESPPPPPKKAKAAAKPAAKPATRANAVKAKPAPKPAKSRKGKAPPAPDRKNGTSPLERLPSELLQDIFLLCKSLDLPSASPFIGAALSSEHVYLRLCDDVFKPVKPDGDAELALQRSRVLAQRWMTLPFWQKMVQRISSTTDQHRGLEDTYKRWDMGRINGTRVPVRLLRAPITAEKAEFIVALTSYGAGIDTVKTSDLEVAEAGMRDAIATGNLTAVKALLTLPAPWNKGNLKLDMAMLRSAVLDAPTFNRTLVKAVAGRLFHQDVKQLDGHDPKLRAWAQQQSDAGNEDACWLLSLLETSADVRQSGQGAWHSVREFIQSPGSEPSEDSDDDGQRCLLDVPEYTSRHRRGHY